MASEPLLERPARVGPAPLHVLGVLLAVNIVANLDRTAFSILMPAIKRDLVLSDSQLGLLTGLLFAAFYAIFGMPLARVADHGHRPRLLGLCVLAWSGLTAATGLATSFLHLALARMGVAVGEAGGVPAGHSMISDAFPPSRRAWALGIHSTGVPLGALAGLAGGGLLADAIGWRSAFLVLGLVGPPLALWLLLLKERRTPPPAPAAGDRGGARELLANGAFRLLLAGFAFASFALTGLIQWLPSYFVRAFGLTTSETGVQFGLAYGLGALAGMVAGGVVGSRLAARDARWTLWLASLSYVAAFPFLLGIILAGAAGPALACVFIGTAVASMAYGPAYAMIQNLATDRTRALASAMALFVANLVGAGLGPVAVGALSDRFNTGDAVEALRTALLWMYPALAAPALLYWLASRKIPPGQAPIA